MASSEEVLQVTPGHIKPNKFSLSCLLAAIHIALPLVKYVTLKGLKEPGYPKYR